MLLLGILFASGRRTVSSWLRAAGVSDDYQGYYYFLQSLGHKTNGLAERLLVIVLARVPLEPRVLLAVDDTPTKRYGRKVQGAGIHHNPTPGPADHEFLYGHIWVSVSLVVRHALWGTIGLPLLARLYVRANDICRLPEKFGWSFRTKLELATDAVLCLPRLLNKAGKAVWVVADGAYAKRPFLQPLIAAGVVVVSRLRKDAALFSLPHQPPSATTRRRGRPQKYGKKRFSLIKRGAQTRGWDTVDCVLYGQLVTKTIKTFLATYPPVGGVIRVVIVCEPSGCQHFFCTDPNATAREILETFADRAAIEQDYHDVKENWGAGQQQVRNLWCNIAVFHLNLWMRTLVELWSWHKTKAEICDRRDSPWDDPHRRPSHADRRKALQSTCLTDEVSQLLIADPIRKKLQNIIYRLTRIAL